MQSNVRFRDKADIELVLALGADRKNAVTMTNRGRNKTLTVCLVASLFAILTLCGLYRLLIWYGVTFSIGI